MAKMAPGIHFSGNLGNINFYQVEGLTYARKKSSLTRKRVLESKEFANTRKHAGDMALASQIASAIYRELPTDIKGRWIFRAITGEASSLLYKGKGKEKVKNILWEKYIKSTGLNPINTNVRYTSANIRSTKKTNKLFKAILLEQWEKQGKPVPYFNRAWKKGRRFNPDTIPRQSEYFLGFNRQG